MSASRMTGALRAMQYLAVSLLVLSTAAWAAGPTGAIFTTDPGGTIVNENVHYQSKIYVYLDGGPKQNAPQTAAGLDDGLYVFQVTDPSGQYLLSMDPAKCRIFKVLNGIITGLVAPSSLTPPLTNTWVAGPGPNGIKQCHVTDSPDGAAGSSGQHDINTDADYGSAGAVVIQLMPFGDTPNPGNVYKAWAEKLATYLAKGGDLTHQPTQAPATKKVCPNFCAVRDPGFGPPNTDTKTDNFKVKQAPFVTPEIEVLKFHDVNDNGVFDPGTDAWVTGWDVSYVDPGLGFAQWLTTPHTLLAANAGVWSFTEDEPAGTEITASFVDGVQTSPLSATVNVGVAGLSGETHQVVFGNVGLGSVEVCKSYGSGAVPYATPIPNAVNGWKIVLTGTGLNGSLYNVEGLTGQPAAVQSGSVLVQSDHTGCVTFSGLRPGAYTVAEVLPPGSGWSASGPTSYNFTIESNLAGSVISGGTFQFVFVNFCTALADFDTKGYWHNKNGIAELTLADIAYVNGLDPYDSPTTYWDLPFDGVWTPSGNTYFGIGVFGEVSDYIVNYVSVYPQNFQLSQQLLAFIFNVRHRPLGNPLGVGGSIDVPGLGWMTVSDILTQAIAAWNTSGTADDVYWIGILDGLNNNDSVTVSSPTACALPNFQ